MTQPSDYPGFALGLPASGRGALASWRSRVSALVIDWGASMAVAVGAFGSGIFEAGNWRSWLVLTVFFVQKALLTALIGSSFGQLITGVGVTLVDGNPVGWWRAIARAAMVSVVLPAVLIGPDRRSLGDLSVGAVVVNRR